MRDNNFNSEYINMGVSRGGATLYVVYVAPTHILGWSTGMGESFATGFESVSCPFDVVFRPPTPLTTFIDPMTFVCFYNRSHFLYPSVYILFSDKASSRSCVNQEVSQRRSLPELDRRRPGLCPRPCIPVSSGFFFFVLWQLKEFYTCQTTLAQKTVFTPLNNEFTAKNRHSTSFMVAVGVFWARVGA